jgi:hypothetical protein
MQEPHLGEFRFYCVASPIFAAIIHQQDSQLNLLDGALRKKLLQRSKSYFPPVMEGSKYRNTC